MKERMPPIEVLKKPIEDRLLEPVARLANVIEENVERRRKEMFQRMGGAMQRLAKQPTIAAAFLMSGLLSYIPKPSSADVFDPAYGMVEGGTRESFEAKRDRLTDYLGEELVSEQIPVQSADRDVERRKERQHSHERAAPAEVEGFEEALGIRHELVETLLRDGYPRGFGGQDAVERIRYTLERIPMHPSYGIHGYEAGHCTVGPGEGTSEIVVTVDGMSVMPDISARMQVEESFGPLLSHELAHASDWQMAAALSPETRLDLLDRVSRRLQDPQAVPFGYVQRIRNPHGNLQEERLSKAKEYFAELLSTAFSVSAAELAPFENPVRGLSVNFARRFGGRPERYIADAQLVVDHVRQLDSRYQWEKGADAREHLLEEMAEQRARHLLDQAVGQLRSPALAGALQETMRFTLEEAERETPLALLGGGLVRDEKEGEDEFDEEIIARQLGEAEASRFSAMRERLRNEWDRDLEERAHGFPDGMLRAFTVWDDLVQTAGMVNHSQLISTASYHRSIAVNVEALNRALEDFRHDGSLVAQFELMATEYLNSAHGRVPVSGSDLTALKRYAKALRLGREAENYRLTVAEL